MFQRVGTQARMLRASAVLALAFLGLAGCNKLKLAFDLAPWYAERYAKELLPELNAAQAQKLKTGIQRYWAWERRAMFPAYAAALRNLADGLDAKRGASSQALAAPLFTGLYAQSLEPLLKPAASLLHSFSPEQIDGLEKVFDKRQAQARKDYLQDPEATMKRRVKRLAGFLESLGGPFSKAQHEQLNTLSRSFPIPYQPWIDDRGRRQSELIEALRAKRNEAQIQALLRDWWLRPRSGGEEREGWQWDEDALQAHVQAVIALWTPEQRVNAQAKLWEWADFLEAQSLPAITSIGPAPTVGLTPTAALSLSPSSEALLSPVPNPSNEVGR